MDSIYEQVVDNSSTSDQEGQIPDGFGEAQILVLGVGGAGNNTINRLNTIGINGAKLIAVNTDKQHLELISANKKMLIGYELTKGLGAGGYPEVGAQSAMEAKPALKEILDGADLIFLTGGLGGGTGTGALPVIAEIAKSSGAVVVGAVTMPFKIERARIPRAKDALMKLKKHADSVVVIDNNKLLDHVPDIPMDKAFLVADDVMSNMVKGITETIATPSLVNLDFADVRSVMEEAAGKGIAMIGLGESDTRNRAEEAVMHAVENPLLDVDYRGALGAMVHITGGSDLTLAEATKIGEIATTYLRNDANVIWGARIDPDFEGKVRVMVIITGVKSPDIVGPMSTNIEVPRRQSTDSLGYLRRPKRLPTSPTRKPVSEGIMANLGIDYII
jgi:cell division protein FtsZ|tara:strand:+ start:204 stop:1370 length:1167 start_codon:yes stop_codon:yes gene_type:complete